MIHNPLLEWMWLISLQQSICSKEKIKPHYQLIPFPQPLAQFPPGTNLYSCSRLPWPVCPTPNSYPELDSFIILFWMVTGIKTDNKWMSGCFYQMQIFTSLFIHHRWDCVNIGLQLSTNRNKLWKKVTPIRHQKAQRQAESAFKTEQTMDRIHRGVQTFEYRKHMGNPIQPTQNYCRYGKIFHSLKASRGNKTASSFTGAKDRLSD